MILWDCLWGLGVAWVLLGTRLSARMRNLTERITRFKWLQTGLYAIQYIILVTLLTLPWNVYENFIRETSTDFPIRILANGWAISRRAWQSP